jgi:hypothetical protein
LSHGRLFILVFLSLGICFAQTPKTQLEKQVNALLDEADSLDDLEEFQDEWLDQIDESMLEKEAPSLTDPGTIREAEIMDTLSDEQDKIDDEQASQLLEGEDEELQQVSGANPYQPKGDPIEVIQKLQQPVKDQRALTRKDLMDRGRKYRDYQYYLELEDILKSDIFKGVVKRGTYLYSVPKMKKYRLNRDITVWAHHLADKEKYIYITNKQYQIKYKVFAKNIHNVERVANLEVPPSFYQEYDPSIRQRAREDDNPKSILMFDINLDYISSDFTADVLDSFSAEAGYGYRAGFSTLYKFSLPFDIGARIEMEQGFFDLETNESTTKTTISLGPIIRWKPLKIKRHTLFISTAFLFSLNSRLSGVALSNNRNIKLSSNAFELNIAKRRKNKVGHYFYGLAYKRSWTRTTSDQGSIAISDTEKIDDSLGVVIGQEF